jgi:flagellar biosynthesis protein FliQ
MHCSNKSFIVVVVVGIVGVGVVVVCMCVCICVSVCHAHTKLKKSCLFVSTYLFVHFFLSFLGTTGAVTEWLSNIPKTELDSVWTQLKFAIEADPGLGVDLDEIDAATTSRNAANTFVKVIAHHPRKADIIALAHTKALEHSPSYNAHVANAGSVICHYC